MSAATRAAFVLLASGLVLPLASQPGTGGAAALDSPGELAAALRAPRTLQSRLRFDHLTSADGLSNDSVFSILQDRHGFIWFGTQAGLNRYDGYRVTQYRYDPRNPNSLASDFVQVLMEDRRGAIWTAGGLLCRFDPETATFTRFPVPQGSSADGRPLAVQAMAEDVSGRFWLGMSGGRQVYRFDPQTGSLAGFDIGASSPAQQDNPVVSMHRDPAEMIWLGSASGLLRLDPSTGACTNYFGHHPGRAISQDLAGNLWLAVAGGAPNFFDPVRGVYSHRWGPAKREHADAPTTSILAGPDGVVWLGTMDRLELFDPATGAFGFLRHNAADRHSISANEVLSLARDRDGGVWVGTKGRGANRLSPETLRFGPWRPDPAGPQGLSDENVRAVYVDRAGAVWLGTYDGGLNRFDPLSGTFTRFRHDARRPASLDDDRVYSIYEDRAGDLWVGTGRGINRLDRKTGAFTHFQRGPLDAGGAMIPTYSFLEDRRGVFWFGAGEARATLDRRTGEVTSVAPSGGLSMYEDREGNLWFASIYSLTKMDRSGNTRKIDPPRAANANLPGTPQINFIHEDPQGLLWFAAETGLLRFNPKTEEFRVFTTSDGLPDNVVQCMLPDRDGNFWLSTNSGLSRFNPRDSSFTNYHESDGLQGEQFNRKACFLDPNGVMYFGGLHGFNRFDPRRIPAGLPETGRVVLTELRINGNTVPVLPGSVLPKPVWEIDALHLTPSHQEFSLDFAALTYRGQERMQYRFLLEGLEEQWTRVDSRHRSARYTGLRPGTYRFRAQASLDGRTWGPQEAAIAISVAPPWWMTLWSLAGGIVAFSSLLFGVYTLRVRALHTRERLLTVLVDRRTSELVEARNQAEQAKNQAEQANRAKSAFLANMSHELRTPLNAILGFSHLLRGTEVSDRQRRDLDIINRSGQHLLTLINDVLDVAKIEAGRTSLATAPCDLQRLVRDVAEMMRVRAEEKQLQLLVVEAPGFPRFVEADAAKLRQILINLLGNAVKFTAEGSVTLHLSAQLPESGETALVRFEVEDTGTGIAPEDRERIFEAFEQVAGSAGQKGTGLGLAIAKQFVELMGGAITLESVPGKGSRFRAEIPLRLAPEAEGTPPEFLPRVVGLEPGQPERRILVVDDHEESRVLLERMLREVGLQVRTAADGGLAVELFPEWRPHLVFMDLSMPRMDGIETARRIRGLPGSSDVKIAAMTASAFAPERERVLASGMHDFLTKPCRPQEVFDCLARHLGLRYRTVVEEAAAAPEKSQRTPAESLAAIPPGLARELAGAVVSLDRERVAAAIAKVEEIDPSLAAVLRGMHDRFTYTAMLKLIDSSRRESARSGSEDPNASAPAAR